MQFFRLIAAACVIAVATGTAAACDLCGCYTPQVETMPQSSMDAGGAPLPDGQHGTVDRFYAAVAEQFTHFGTLQFEGVEVSNPTGQYEDSSITQFVAGYNFTPRCALQVNVPLIYRSFQRPGGFAVDRGTESGLGDVSLLTRFVLFHTQQGGRREVLFDSKSPRMVERDPDFISSVVLIAGVKFPTGATNRLKEEFDEEVIPGAPESGIHGHDLTLGSGSYDGLFGGQTSIRYLSFYFQAEAQFALRGDGAHQYHFANDISWSGGPGWYLIRRRDVLVGLQCVCSGEEKGLDRFRGKQAGDTGITSVFLGPRIIASLGKVSAEIAAELPVVMENTALQIVPDYRIRAGISFRF